MLTRNFKQLQNEVADHVKADRVAQGSYETCFGCLTNQKDNPEFIEETYGIPISLLRLSESIFKDLHCDEAVDFFAKFSKAVGSDGKDLTLVVCQFLAAELRALPTVSDEIQVVINLVIEGMDLLSRGEPWPDARAAADAAFAAADTASYYAAADAAYYATKAAYCADTASYYAAADAAYYATKAAYCAAALAANEGTDKAAPVYAAAADAAFAAADKASAIGSFGAARLRQRDTLLRLIKGAPINIQEENSCLIKNCLNDSLS